MKYDEIQIGKKGSFTKPVTDEDNRLFAEISGDYNPIHFHDSAASAAGFNRRISNGFVTESRIAAALVETFGSKHAVVLALEKNTRFLKPVYMGDEITATVEVVEKLEGFHALRVHAECINQRNEKVVDTNMTIRILPVAR
jgi:acyl dehydratase